MQSKEHHPHMPHLSYQLASRNTLCHSWTKGKRGQLNGPLGRNDCDANVQISARPATQSDGTLNLLFLLPHLLQPTATTSINKMAHQSSSSPGEVHVGKITVQNNYGENLVGLLHETGSTGLVILCHGLGASKEDTTMVNLADAITKVGISVFRFDFAGNGESEGSFEFGNYLREVDDLRSVVLYFSGGKHAIITVLGHSKGGNVVLLYASKYHDVPTIVNVSGRYDLKKGLDDRFGKDFLQNIKRDGFVDVMGKRGEVLYRITEESLMERLGTDMHAACLSIDSSNRVLTVHGTSDEAIPVEDAFEFAMIIPNHKLHIIEGADHVYSKHQSELAEVVVNFIKASL